MTANALGYGIFSNNQANVTFTGGTVTTSGLTANGLYALNGGIITVNGGTVTVSGPLAYGAYAINGGATLNLNNVTFNLTGSGGSNGVGINVTDTGRGVRHFTYSDDHQRQRSRHIGDAFGDDRYIE